MKDAEWIGQNVVSERYRLSSEDQLTFLVCYLRNNKVLDVVSQLHSYIPTYCKQWLAHRSYPDICLLRLKPLKYYPLLKKEKGPANVSQTSHHLFYYTIVKVIVKDLSRP